MNQEPFERVLDKLQVSMRASDHAQVRCPTHDDKKASLRVTECNDGTVVLFCHAGCKTEDIVASIGLTMADLFARPLERDATEHTYDYQDVDGRLVYQVVRRPGKQFLQRRPDGQGGWIWNLQGVQPLLYRLPNIHGKRAVVIVEGEKDVERLGSIGIPATCNSGGAGKWHEGHGLALKGTRVVIIPDNDSVGFEHANMVAASLERTYEAPRILILPGLPEKGDISDWLDQGHTRDELFDLMKAAPKWDPEHPLVFEGQHDEEREALLSTIERVRDLASNKDVEVQDTIAQAERLLAQLRASREPQTERSIDDVVLDYLQAQEDLASGRRSLGVSTGYTDLDAMLGGLNRSDLIIVAARPGMGKTSLVVNIGINVAAALGRPTLMFSLEMGAEQIAARVLSSMAGIDLSSLRQGKIEPGQAAILAHQAASLVGVPFFIEPSPYLTVDQLRTRAHAFLARHGRLGLVIVDYLQLMSGSGSRQNKVQEVTEISRALKGLARELEVPVLALSQLSRSVEQREKKIPQLSDLRESGAIEQDADAVLAVFRDDYYDDQTERPGLADLIILKHRNGPTGRVTLYFDKATTTFRSLESFAQH